MRPSPDPFDKLLKMASAGVLGRMSPCDVPQGYASVITLPAALAYAILTSLWFRFVGISRLATILNVPLRVRLRFWLACGLVGCHFDEPAGIEAGW
mgnify:CR=1 FL=1